MNLKQYCDILSYNDIIRILTKEKPMRTEKKFKIKAVFFVVLAAIMIILQLPQQVCATEQKDTIVVGTNAEYAPFEYLDSNGNLTGFDIDLMNAIAKEENVNIKWVDLPFDSLLGSIEAGDIEAIAASIAPTKERAQSVDFSDVYYTGSQSIAYRTGDEYTDFSELTGKTRNRRRYCILCSKRKQ